MATNTAAIQQRVRSDADAIIADRGGRDALSTVMIAASTELAFVMFVLDQWKHHFIAKGLTTERGRVRSAYASYLSTLDRYIRLAGMIGVDRQAKRAQSPREWLESLDKRDEHEQPTNSSEPDHE